MGRSFKIFAEKLKELRTENNLSIKALARELGISDVAIGRWERCLQAPNINMIELVADYFKVTPDYLMGYIN